MCAHTCVRNYMYSIARHDEIRIIHFHSVTGRKRKRKKQQLDIFHPRMSCTESSSESLKEVT